MARPLRIEFPEAGYHITARENERPSIFFCAEDRRRFPRTLDVVCVRFNWRCHAYCQMANHYHLLVETLEGNLSKGDTRASWSKMRPTYWSWPVLLC